MREKFKFLEHTADVKFQSYGFTLEKAFENSALAMFNVMYEGKVKAVKNKKIKVKGKDKESLLYNFLEEFLFLLDTENFVLSKVSRIKIKQNRNKETKNNNKEYELEAEVLGDNASNYKFDLDVKAVTYNEMFVKKQEDKRENKGLWVCQVVVDV